jgi:endonuclease/exonuclease/phosphatase family metal-dependent hydrolase
LIFGGLGYLRAERAAPGPRATIDVCEPALSERTRLPSPETLRVVTYNVDRDLDAERVARSIEGEQEISQADVLMLQEVETSGVTSLPQTLADRLGLSVLYAPARYEGDRTHGVALLSRHRLLDPEFVELTRYDLGYRSRRRVALGATVEIGGHRLRLYNTHLDTRLTLSQRVRQMEPLIARSHGVPHAIVGGDVNTIRAVGAFLPLFPLPLPGLGQAGGLDDFMRRHGFETPSASLGATGPLGMRLDAIFTRGLSVSAAGKGRGGFSDHVPVWVDISVSAPSDH